MVQENFISEALCYPSDYVAYYVSHELAELYSEKAVIESDTDCFDLEDYVRGGHCFIVQDLSVYNQIKTEWQGPRRKLRRQAENAWYNVSWQGHFLDVVLLTWMDDGCKTRHTWIVADAEDVAENFLKAVCEWSTEVRGEVLVFEDGYWGKNKELFKAIKGATFDNLILRGSLKQEIQDDFVRFFKAEETYARYGIPWKRGVLLIGAPGLGKTHTVKALINLLGQPCLYVKSFKSYYGTEHDNIARVFRQARRTKPCLLVLEDLDSLIDDRNRSFFLNELDGFAVNTGVLVLATTNHPERLDTAILDRPSRFDRKYYFELPGATERAAYINAWNAALQAELQLAERSVRKIVEQTEEFSFAYLKELFLSSMMQWMSAPESQTMASVVLSRTRVLREQMKRAVKDKKKDRKRKRR